MEIFQMAYLPEICSLTLSAIEIFASSHPSFSSLRRGPCPDLCRVANPDDVCPRCDYGCGSWSISFDDSVLFGRSGPFPSSGQGFYDLLWRTEPPKYSRRDASHPHFRRRLQHREDPQTERKRNLSAFWCSNPEGCKRRSGFHTWKTGRADRRVKFHQEYF